MNKKEEHVGEKVEKRRKKGRKDDWKQKIKEEKIEKRKGSKINDE